MTETTNPTAVNAKNDAGKPRLELVPGRFLRRARGGYDEMVPNEFDGCWDRPEVAIADLIQGVKYAVEEMIQVIDDGGLDPLQEMLAARMDGVKKYAPFNWVNVTSLGRWVGAFRRHVIAQGPAPESPDAFKRAEDSGVTHLGHALCTLVFLEESLRNGWYVDDRQEGLGGK